MSKSRTPFISGFAGLLTIICMASPVYALDANTIPEIDGAATGGSWNSTTATFTQTDPRAVANWKSFDVGASRTVTFAQNKTDVALNRISGSASQIYGKLNAAGTVILVNQAGINFASGSTVNVGKLIATTSKISDTDFNNGNYTFTKGSNPSAQIVNDGTITAADGGLVALVAPTVKNSGVITAKAGKVHLASGDAYTVDLYGDNLLALQASDDITAQMIQNSGEIYANGGDVLMTAAAAKNVVDSLINMNGIIEAKSVGSTEGRVTLDADTVNIGAGAKILATGLNEGEKGGEIEIDAKNVTIGTNSRMIAAGYNEGGEIDVDASKDIVVNENALLCAKSIVADKGGDIKLDGASVSMKKGSRLNTTGGELKVSGTNPDGVAKNGVTLNGATLTAGSGKIIIEGEGTKNAIIGSQGNHGVKIFGGSILKTTGAGTIDIKGTGGNGGYTDFNTGVFISGSSTLLSTERGSLTIEGFGGGKDWSAMAHGIMINDNAVVMSDTGTITLNGIAGGGCNCTHNDWGVAVLNAKVKTTSGDIVVFGKGGDARGANTESAYTDNYGVYVGNKGEITSASGNIDITGVGGGDKSAAKRNYGIFVDGNAVIGTPAKMPLDRGTIRFVADTLEMDNTVKISTTNTVFFEPYTDSTTIGVAGAVGTLQIDEIVLGDIKNAGHITIGNTNRDTGLLTANRYAWQADVSLLNKDGNINIDGRQSAQEGNNDSFDFLAWTVNGDITIGSSGSIASGKTSGTPITLASSNGRFTNNGTAGADVLSVAEGARWLVYSGSPMTDTYNGLGSDFRRYSCTYSGTCTPTIPDSGNGFIYSVTPVMTVAANDEHVTYGGDAPAYSIRSATETYTFKGVTYDLIGTSFSDIADVALTSPYVKGNNVGSYPINPINTNAPVVGYTFNPIAGTLTVDPATLRVAADNKSMIMGGTIPPLTYTYSGLVNGDTSSIFTGGLALGGASGATYPILQGTLSAGSNYTIVYTPGVLTVAGVDPHNVLERWKNLGKRGPNGILLAIVNTNEAAVGNLADLAPAAGGDNPQRLADLAPKAGGNTGITPLVQCDQNTPCDINQ